MTDIFTQLGTWITSLLAVALSVLSWINTNLEVIGGAIVGIAVVFIAIKVATGIAQFPADLLNSITRKLRF
jgi:type III secretory pathway component EscR